MRRLFILLTTVCLLTACAFTGRPLDAAVVNNIVPGQTSKAELIERFGLPFNQTFNENGLLQMMWMHMTVGPFGLGTKVQNLIVLFNGDDRVQKYSFTSPPPGTNYDD